MRHNFVHHSPQAHGVYCDDGDSGDRIESNLFYKIDAGVFIGGGHDNSASSNKEELQFSKMGKNLEYKKGSFFVAPEKLDFRLRDDAPFLKELPGFRRFDLGKIGLYKDEDRTGLPTDAELRRNADVGKDDRNDADPLNAK